MTWRLHSTYLWPAPAKVGVGLYDAWAELVRGTGSSIAPVDFKRCELQVEIEDRPEINLVVLLAWIERLLKDLRITPADIAFRGATIWRNGSKEGVRVTLWEVES